MEERVTAGGRTFRVTPVEQPAGVEMPEEFTPRRLLRRTLQVVALLVVLGLVLLLAPGLGHVRQLLTDAQPGWVALAVAFEGLSCVSYVLMFRPIFCRHMPWRTSWEIGLAELGAGSIIPASGAGGLALGAWILSEGGMPGEQIARRSVAFFLIKSSVNFVAVAVLGTIMALGLVGPDQPLWLTALPALGAIVVIAVVLVVPRLGLPGPLREDAGKAGKAWWHTRKALAGGTAEAVQIVRTREALVIVGAIGYWAWDNAALWATFHAFGYSPPITIILMGYLIGQLGGLLPLPGGLGGIDGGLIGTLIVYGTPPAVTAAAVLVYRVILFWLPLMLGAVAFGSLRRGLNDPDRPELCVVPAAI
ncbi:MAG TPA: flippase-like domain-containing protein [Thermoleophilaceae bacterium]|nr:flippase-like domain-containing protein [Thermoleophilaceae bacterium]